MEELDGAKSLFCFNSDHQGGHFLGVNFFPGKKKGGGGIAFHLVEIFAINEWKLKRSILNRIKYQAVNREIKGSNSLLKHFSYVTLLRTILINANKIPFTR